MKTGKHVIFLGAGASHCSGYPLANGLRLLISSEKKWEKALVDYDDKHKLSLGPIRKIGVDYWNNHADSLNLFRKGGFATIDEFCKLAGESNFRNEVNGLRCILRAALGLFNPEENFEKSEYHGFIQSLFKSDLVSLREDVTVLTYNYDPYFEFLLHRALGQRWQVGQYGKSIMVNSEDVVQANERDKLLNSVTSGFSSVGNFNWLGNENSERSFCVLKLHGSICYPVESQVGYQTLFEIDALRRAERIFSEPADSYIPPILFPWEIMTEKGFVEEHDFSFRNQPALYLLFRRIWERARREVQSADKISFVGMSMHDFLEGGLKYLFNDRTGQVEVCVTNPDNTAWVRNNRETYWQNKPHTSAYLVNQTLRNIAPKMIRVGMNQGSLETDMITLVNDFGSFVKTQMKPITIN